MSRASLGKVVIVQEQIAHYRTTFFELLRERLNGADCELTVIQSRSDDQRLIIRAPSWAETVSAHRLGPLVWQRAWRLCSSTDLVIVPQELKYCLSYALGVWSRLTDLKIGIWGHGRNFQAVNPDSPAERVKRFLSRYGDWWFAYNDLSAQVVEDLGYPPERITSVRNAVDTTGLVRRRKALTAAQVHEARERCGIPPAVQVGLFSGGLYDHKRLPFLLEAADRIRQHVPDFHLLVIGDGPERPTVAHAASSNPWIHYVGKLDDDERVPYWGMADVVLMPGLVGLVIVDSFAFGVPMVTTAYPYHSPEIDYLRPGENGLMVEAWQSPGAYADRVVQILKDEQQLRQLEEGAIRSAERYSVEQMAERMATGIVAALQSAPLRRRR